MYELDTFKMFVQNKLHFLLKRKFFLYFFYMNIDLSTLEP